MTRKRIGELAVDLGYITQAERTRALLQQHAVMGRVKLGQILIRCGYMTHEQLRHVLRLQRTGVRKGARHGRRLPLDSERRTR